MSFGIRTRYSGSMKPFYIFVVVLLVLMVLAIVFIPKPAHGATPAASDIPPAKWATNPIEFKTVDDSLPAQAQASAMAVPEPGLEYASALLVVHCRKVEALVLIDSHGEQHPYHGKEATLAQVLTMLSPVPADKVTQVTIACPGELGM